LLPVLGWLDLLFLLLLSHFLLRVIFNLLFLDFREENLALFLFLLVLLLVLSFHYIRKGVPACNLCWNLLELTWR